MSKLHSQATTIHKGGYIQSSDPGVVGAKVLWFDISSAPYELKRRNDTDDGWDSLGFLSNTAAIANGTIINVLDPKQSVRAATTTNITLSGAQTIDGVSVITGDRVLVKDQSSGGDNGVYVAASGAWARATDADTSTEVTAGMLIPVSEGTDNGNKLWMLTTNDPIVLGTTVLVFSQIGSSVGAPVDATYITKTSNGTLSNEFALGSLTTGILKSTTTTGDVSTADVNDISSPVYAADGGSTDAYAMTLSPAPSAYQTGALYRFKANTANTGPATLNVNGLGAKTIKKAEGGITTDLSDNDIHVGQIVDCVYDGTNMQMQSNIGNSASGGGGTDATTTWAFSGDISPSQITANQNDYNPTGLSNAGVVRLSSDAERDLSGLAGGADGRILILSNVGSNNIRLLDESASSTATNRFLLITTHYYLTPEKEIVIQYDSTLSRWKVWNDSVIQQTAADTLKILSSTAKLYFNTDVRFEWNGTVLKATDNSNAVELQVRTLRLDAGGNNSYYIKPDDGILVGAGNKLGFARNSTTATPGAWLQNDSAQRGVIGVYGNFGSGDVGGTLKFKPERPTQITTNQNDYQTATVSKYVLLDSNTAVNITGLKDATSPSSNFAQDGEERVIINIGANNITLKNEDTGSTAQFRFHNSTGTDIVLTPDQGADLVYDSTLVRWRVFKRN